MELGRSHPENSRIEGPAGWRPFLLATACVGGAAALLVCSGLLASTPLLSWLVTATQRANPRAVVIVASESEGLLARADLVAALVLPLALAWVGLLLHQLRWRRLPSPGTLAVAFAVPLPLVLVAMSLRTWAFLARLGADGVGASSLAPHPSLRSLAPGGSGVTAALLITGLTLALLALWRVARGRPG